MFFFLISCSDHSLQKRQESNAGSLPILSVSPEIVDFGVYESNPIVEEITISNIGEGKLQVQPLAIVGEEASSFFFMNPAQALELLEGESHSIMIAFEATSADNDAQVEVSSNDSNTGDVLVSLRGQAMLPELQVVPNPLELGDVSVDCTIEQQILLSNVGEAPLSIFAITETPNPVFSFAIEQEFPMVLNPSGFYGFSVFFSPSEIADYQYELQVLSNDPESVKLASIMGSGVAQEQEDVWIIDAAPRSDILFAVDLSGSMSDEALVLGQQFSTFITELSSYTSDWQVMVVNADHGCNHSGILTPTTPGYEPIFSEAVRTGAYDISFTEALLTNVTHAVEKADVGECNEGFLRADAMLHIIMLSDECEQSPNPGICGTQWQSYIDRVIAAKGNPDLVRMSAVAGDYPSGCGNPQTAEFGSGYWEASQITGGTFLSICSDWTSPLSLQQLASNSISQSRFLLSSIPIEATIVVKVDSILHTDWSFDAVSNEIVMSSSFPSSGSEVQIVYYQQSNCEQ